VASREPTFGLSYGFRCLDPDPSARIEYAANHLIPRVRVITEGDGT
jgi:hypothetical protein